MKTKFIFLLAITLFFAGNVKSEVITQTIKGRVIDIENKIPLPGANIIVLNSDPLTGTVTDGEGYFRLDNIPVGRVSLKVTYLGYLPSELNNLNLSSGK